MSTCARCGKDFAQVRNTSLCCLCDAPPTPEAQAEPPEPLLAKWREHVRTGGIWTSGHYIAAEMALRIAQQAERVTALEQENRILKLSTPLEDDLSPKIDEMCKYLAMEQGFTLNGIARLLIECQRRMADDWTEVGQLRRESKTLEAQNRALRERMTTLAEQWERVRRLSDSAFGDCTSRAEIDLVKSAHERCSKQLRAALAPSVSVAPEKAPK